VWLVIRRLDSRAGRPGPCPGRHARESWLKEPGQGEGEDQLQRAMPSHRATA
jgi:hypothetical protein